MGYKAAKCLKNRIKTNVGKEQTLNSLISNLFTLKEKKYFGRSFNKWCLNMIAFHTFLMIIEN